MIHPQSTAAPGRHRTLTRQVPHTIDGQTRMVTATYEVPAPPRDIDRVVHLGITIAATALVVVSIAWSTASIGALLARSAPAPVAYSAAAGFDLVWIICMGAEWLARYDRHKAAVPRRAGHTALLIAMAAVAANGWLSASLAVGMVGAVVSALAKTAWTIVIRHDAKPLDPLTEQWVTAQLAEAGARLAMVPVRRQLARAEGLLAAERHALGFGQDSHQGGDDNEDNAEDNEDSTSGALFTPESETITDTIRRLLGQGITKPHLILFGVQTVHGFDNINAKSVTRILNRELPTTT